jgi:hypothetical protein
MIQQPCFESLIVVRCAYAASRNVAHRPGIGPESCGILTVVRNVVLLLECLVQGFLACFSDHRSCQLFSEKPGQNCDSIIVQQICRCLQSSLVRPCCHHSQVMSHALLSGLGMLQGTLEGSHEGSDELHAVLTGHMHLCNSAYG